MLTILFLSLFSFTLAVPSQEECDLLADYAQPQLSSISPFLQYTADSIEIYNNDLVNAGQDEDPEVTSYLDALSNLLTQIDLATGSSSDPFRAELTQNCGPNPLSRRWGLDVDDMSGIVNPVYTSVSSVVNVVVSADHARPFRRLRYRVRRLVASRRSDLDEVVSYPLLLPMYV
jgi:hypothetical protein